MLNIVLYQPEIPQNTGNIARTCTAIGAKLHIIKPIPFEISDKTVKRAGLDYWQYLDIEIHDDFEAFMRKYGDNTFYFCSTKAEKLYTDVKYEDNIFLMFGPETRGLPEDLIFGGNGTAVTIPMQDKIRSLNLSNAVAIIAYEVVRQRGL
jgi:tRNA (cytidine/uridine-2'-O-)-methyltransferase